MEREKNKTYPGKFKHLSGEILQYGGHIHSCLGAYAHLVLRVLLEETLDAAARELECRRLAMVQRTKQGGDASAAEGGCGAARDRETVASGAWCLYTVGTGQV